MGPTTPAELGRDLETIRDQHATILDELAEFEAALEALSGPAGVSADCSRLDRVRWLSGRLGAMLLEHFRDETELLKGSAADNRHLKQFFDMGHREHAQLVRLLNLFRGTAGAVTRADDGGNAVMELKSLGCYLIERVAQHIDAEEREMELIL